MQEYFRKIKSEFDNNLELKKVLININWLFFERILQLGTAFFVGVWVIRYLGPEKYGTLSYAVAFVFFFSVISRLGLDDIVIRELIREPEKKSKILGTAFLLKFFGGILAVLLSTSSIFFLKNTDPKMIFYVAIVAVSLIFQSFDIIDFWFQSNVKSKHVSRIRIGTSIISITIKLLLVFFKASLTAFVWVIFIESLLNAIGFLFIYKIKNEKVSYWSFDFLVAKMLFRESWPLILSGVAITLYMKIDQIMIGNILGNKQLGIYSAAVSLSEVWYYFPTIIIASVFPAIIYSKKISEEVYLKRLQMLYGFMLWSSIAIALLVTIFSGLIIKILFGSAYLASSTVLSVYVWGAVAVFLGSVWSKTMLCENKQRMLFYCSSLTVFLNISLNLFFIRRFGLVGAAWATLISYSFSQLIIMIIDNKSHKFLRMIFNSLTLNIFLK